jgi:hypothetical protein
MEAPSTRTKELEELLLICTRIRQLLAAGNFNNHEIGERYNHVVDSELAEKAGFKGAPEFFSQHLKELSRATLAMYGAVARVFSAETCGRHGMTTLSLLLTYKEAAGCELDVKEPGSMLIEVPAASGQVETKFFAECTVADMRKALQRLRRPTSSAPLPGDVLARVEQGRTFWTGYFPKEAGVRVQLRNRGGKPVVSLKDIPLEQWEQLTALVGSGQRTVRAA